MATRPANFAQDLGWVLGGSTSVAISRAVAALVAAGISGNHAHVVGEPFVGDASTTVYYLANEADADTVAAYDVNGARVAITQDATELDKITFTAAPAAGEGWIDYIPASS